MMSIHSSPLPSELGTYKTVKARFWPWLSGNIFKIFHLRVVCHKVMSHLEFVSFDSG
jgi:hypothetical protein